MGHMSPRQYARLIREWVTGIGLQAEDDRTHSLRRTKASIVYKATGNLRAVLSGPAGAKFSHQPVQKSMPGKTRRMTHQSRVSGFFESLFSL